MSHQAELETSVGANPEERDTQWPDDAGPEGFACPCHAGARHAFLGKCLRCSVTLCGRSPLSLPFPRCFCRLARGARYHHCHPRLFLWGRAVVAAQGDTPQAQISTETRRDDAEASLESPCQPGAGAGTRAFTAGLTAGRRAGFMPRGAGSSGTRGFLRPSKENIHNRVVEILRNPSGLPLPCQSAR